MNKKQLEKMLRLSDIKKPINEGTKHSAIELIKSASDGNTYAIVRENRTYYIMKTETKNRITESDFDYIGGLQNRTKNSFRSFEDATFRLNLMFNDINRSNGINESVDMKTFDFVLENGVYVLPNEKESLQEKKFVLKQPKPKKEEPSMDFGDSKGGESEFDFGGEDKGTEGGDSEFDFGDSEDMGSEGGDSEFDFGSDEDMGSEEGGDEFDFGSDEEGGDMEFDAESGDEGDMEFDTSEEGGDSIKDIQRTTGKLGQQLRDTEDLSSDMQKWVAKSVISALNLDTMDDADKEDVINALEKGGKKSEGGESPEIDFMEEEPRWEFQNGRTFEDDEYGPSGTEEDDDDILLDDEGMGGYLGWEDEEYDEIPLSDVDMPIQDKGYLNIDSEVAGGNTSYMDDELDIDGPMVYMTDDDMEPCGPGVDCGGVEEGLSKWNDADNESGMGWETNENVSYMDDEYSEEDIDRMLGNTDTYGMNNPAPVKQPGTADPITKPGTDRPTRPSKSPFSPPDRIRPGEEPKPKARRTDYMAEPAPTTRPGTADPITKPGTDRPTRPSKSPFSPPDRIRPGEEPKPKAGYDDDVTFE